MAGKAIAVFDGKIRGKVIFTEYVDLGLVEIEVDLIGLRRNGVHGFHIHQYGDISEGCNSMCAHFNPYGKKHGGPNSKEHHLGDLGNLEADSYGRVRTKIVNRGIKLHGSRTNVIGRGLVIHADEDDLGLGGNPESLITGNAGKRIACAIIGHAKI
ncbi:MAG: superoxide dismutase family protein [Flavobacteriia bacterium]|jgi:Cu-Zn family superoxide dismutase|nr:superoxide dismutase family protein [Flavobacteriia bacterium]